jgi:glycosyltransferase involved in cell wall biosynthesis
MSRGVVILTEIIAPYRIPVFNALARHAGIDMHVIFLAETDPIRRQWLVYKDEIRFSYEVLPSWRGQFGKHNVLLNRGLGAVLRRLSPDAVLCGGYNYLASWQLMWWARRNRVPFLLWIESTARDQRNGRYFAEFLKTRFVRRCNGLVVPGQSSFEYARSFGVREKSIFIAPNAVDTELFASESDAIRQNASVHRQALRLPRRFFFFAGRLVPEKGVFDLLDGYGKLNPQLRSEIGLVLAGDGISRSELVQRASAIKPGSVHFAGFVHREQLASYYGLAEAFVFATHSDPWGLVVNEAMACALPIISSNAAGCAADLVEDHWNGRVVPAGDSQRLSSAMDEMARDAPLRSLMGQRSRQRIQQYSPEACAGGIAEAVLSFGAPRYE